MLKLIRYNGEVSEKDKLTLEEMQEFVGGYVEKWKNIYCNEDGLRLKLPRNVVDSRFVGNIIIEVK